MCLTVRWVDWLHFSRFKLFFICSGILLIFINYQHYNTNSLILVVIVVVVVVVLAAAAAAAVAAWCSGQHVGRDQQSYSTPGPVSTWMGDHLRTGKPSQYITSHPGQLSLANGHPSVGRRNEYQRKLGSKRAHRTIH